MNTSKNVLGNSPKHVDHKTLSDEQDPARTGVSQANGVREAVAVPSNTATNNSNQEECKVKFLRFGVDSLYLSYHGNLYPDIDIKLKGLKQTAQSEHRDERAKAQYVLDDHIFEVKDKGSSFFNYVMEDNAFRISLSRPGKKIPMAYAKISSEFLTYMPPTEAEKAIRSVLVQLGELEGQAHVSRIDLFVDFITNQDMEGWKRDAWVTHASAVNAYAVDNVFTGWAIGLGGTMAARLYNKLLEIFKSNKGYLIPLWQQAGWEAGEQVWRLEFQFKRDVLTQKGLITIGDVLAHLNGLWSYASTEWCKLTIPNPDDKTRSRWPIHPLWTSLSGLDWETNGGPLSNRFSNQRTPEDRISLGRAFSAFTTWMAAHGFRDYDEAKEPFQKALFHYMNNRAMDAGMSFEELINEKVSLKARQFNTVDNTVDEDDGITGAARAYRKASDGD
ncbi:replication initiation factor [Methylovorus menthalis]|uniref:replication initiation factor n=1 Tax=Methylovorus menthalis TaxID=1002227 RepID=UPI001E2A6423|nr:replication initiation factor [Methylovorus menthalis]MCB4810883.1 replication initiation factor [Methylovorus menthalis]